MIILNVNINKSKLESIIATFVVMIQVIDPVVGNSWWPFMSRYAVTPNTNISSYMPLFVTARKYIAIFVFTL